MQAVGYNNLTEDSSVDDLQEVYDKIESEVEKLDLKVRSLDEDDPEAINDVLTDLMTVSVGVGKYMETMGLNNPYGAETVLGAAGGCAAVGALIGSVIPGVGTAIGAGVGALIGLAGGLIGGLIGTSVGNGNAEEKFNKIKEDIEAQSEKVAQLTQDTTDKFKTYTEDELIPDIEEELEGLLDGEFKFEDINDTRNITTLYANCGKFRNRLPEIKRTRRQIRYGR